MKSLPIVALVGQTNAGKSSLLNRLAKRNIAIVAREEGTTRDNVVATIDNQFILIDTAGLKNPEDDFEASIQDQISDAIDSADLILVTLDSSKFPNQKDRDIARMALKSRKPVLLVLNKSDIHGPADEEFLFGIKPSETIRTSTTTGQGIGDLKRKIYNVLSENGHLGDVPQATAENEDIIKLALIGRPNVGKSSLFNSLSKKQQAVVSSRQGTTRDVNRVQVKYEGQTIEILDTAGLRKPGKREVGIEKFSALRTLAAIEEADVCALLIDSTEPHSKLDQSLAGQIVEAGKGIIVVVTKSDLLSEDTVTSTRETSEHATPVDIILNELEHDFDFLPFAPVLVTSSETGKNVTKLFDLTLQVDAARHTELRTNNLNKILREAIVAHPPAGLKNTHPKPKYIVQTDTCPPWFVIHGREMELMHWSYKRYLERKIREFYPFLGTPIKFSFHNEK
ncbi:MAG: ribosome biogenesis GTPase Der [Candidatus Saccharibacteria bacterium]|nr:ribosome biogenesis GTPase Der [Candidatus Saccharibacteria bacterium]